MCISYEQSGILFRKFARQDHNHRPGLVSQRPKLVKYTQFKPTEPCKNVTF